MAIQDPFDPSQAIMPSGQMGSKVFIAPLGTDPMTVTRDTGEWKHIGWSEPGFPFNEGEAS